MFVKVYYAHMSQIIEISTHTPSHVILSWLCAHVGQATVKHVFSACGEGWKWHFASGMTLPDGAVITRRHRVVFDDHVDQDLITQFALTFS